MEQIPERGDSVRLHDIGYLNSNFEVRGDGYFIGENVDVLVSSIQRLCIMRKDLSVTDVDDGGDFMVEGCPHWIPYQFMKTLYAIPY